MTYYVIYNKSINMYMTRNGWTHEKKSAMKVKRLKTIQKHYDNLKSERLKEYCIITEL